MNQTIVSKRYSRHIRERRRCYRLSLSFSQAETGRRTRFVRWRKLQRQQVQVNLCTKNCCEKMKEEKRGKKVDERWRAGRPNYAGGFAILREQPARKFVSYLPATETKRETLNRRSTRSRQLITRGCGARKARVNVTRTIKITKGCSVVCTLAVGNRFPVAGFYENEDK